MYCPKCGTELKEGVKFCNKCGNEVKQVQQPIPVVRPAPQPTPVPRVQPAPQPTPVTRVQPVPQPTPVPLVPQKKKKSKLPIIIGCIAVVFVIAVIGSVYIINNSEDSKADYSGAVINANSSNYEEDIVADDAESEAVVDDIVEHTIMIYMVGSDLETVNGMGSSDIQEIFNADYGDNTRVILQTGGCLDWKIESMADGQVQRFELTDTELIELDSLGQISMLKADTLADFITFASTVSPAEKYSLVMWNHGGGVPIGFGKDEIFPNDKLYDYQIGEALEHAGVYFECVTFDACNMCTLEVAMAIKDYAKYMVAAESRIPGCGMDYTTWLNCYGEDNIDYLASYEVLTSAYMDSLQTVGSISLINLGKIQAVYDAYTQYIQSVHEAVLNGAYEEYTIARSQCGLYECTESVDLVTLATLYPTDASANLINSIVNAVYYTESDYAYGHGLAAYNPISYANVYDYARNNMEYLGYNTTLLDFYDDYVSISLAYLGTEAVNTYAGDWYDASIANSYTGGGYDPQSYQLNIMDMGGYQAIPVAAEEWNIISDVKITSFMLTQDGSNAYSIGEAPSYRIDENGYIVVEKPQKWVFVNDAIANYMVLEKYVDEESGDWSEIGIITATCNGQNVIIYVYYDEEYPQGVIQGYTPYNFWEGSGEMMVYNFTEDDVVEIILPGINMQTGELNYTNYSGYSYYASDLTLSIDGVDFGSNILGVEYEITDVYNNVYTSEWMQY